MNTYKGMAKKPILLVGNFLSASIGRSVCEDLADRFLGLGWPVLVTSRKPGRINRLIDVVCTIWDKRQRYSVAQVDVYSGLAFSLAEIACWVLRCAGKPYILTLRGGNLPVFAYRWPGRVQGLLSSAVLVTTPSRYLLEKLGHFRGDLRLLPNPLDLHNYEFRLRVKPKPHLIWLRAFHKIYNPSLAPKVVASLTQDFPNIHLTMVGPDKKDGSLEAVKYTAVKCKVLDRLTFPGKITKSEVPRWLNQGDIFLNTTNIDNTPVSVLEAMACGLCVVSTNVGGIPYLLENERDALLVPPDNPEAMASAVYRILTEPGLGEWLSSNGRRKTLQFDWSTILPKWESLFNEALARG